MNREFALQLAVNPVGECKLDDPTAYLPCPECYQVAGWGMCLGDTHWRSGLRTKDVAKK